MRRSVRSRSGRIGQTAQRNVTSEYEIEAAVVDRGPSAADQLSKYKTACGIPAQVRVLVKKIINYSVTVGQLVYLMFVFHE